MATIVEGLYDKLETDNPILDEIVYNCKLLIKNCIVKDDREADKYETKETLRNANIYAAIRDNRAYFLMFDYTVSDMKKVGINELMANKYLSDYKQVPKIYWDQLLQNKINDFLATYEELNDYYRVLMGMPSSTDEYIYITDKYNEMLVDPIDKSIPIHKLDTADKEKIISSGIWDILKQNNPKVQWLKNFNKNIDSYIVRKLPKFGLVYTDEVDIEPSLYNRFHQLFETNRVYVMNSLDKDSLRYYNKYYDRFISLIIITQTFCDMVAEIPDYFIRKDVFDIRTCEYFFEANGVEFFPDIPLKFQKKLVQNLNILLKYSSTQRNIVDICSIFGFKNSDVFKYYMLKEHKKDINGNYLPIVDPEDLSKTYDLRFIKVPITENVDDYIKDNSAYQSYEDVISQDQFWDGPFDHDEIRQKILEREFSIEKSKYISIDSMYNLTEHSFTFVYFINMLMWSNVDTSQLNLRIQDISTSRNVNLLDAIILLYALSYLYMDIEDTILQYESQYLTVKGFNFNADLTELSEYIANRGYTLKDLGVSGFQVPASGILSISQMTSIFINNRDIYDHVVKEMYHADNKSIFECYKKIYDSLFYTQLNREYYYIEELGRSAETYKEFLRYTDKPMYDIIVKFEQMSDIDARKNAIFNSINSISNSILNWINDDRFDEIFYNLPVNNKNFIQHYLTEVVEFFLSYKNSLLDFRNIFKFDEEYIFINDEAFMHYVFYKNQYIKSLDMIHNYLISINKDDTTGIEDLIASLTNVYYRQFFDKDISNRIHDKIGYMKSILNHEEWIIYKDNIFNKVAWYFRELSQYIPQRDTLISIQSNFNKDENIKLEESIDFVHRFYRLYEDNITLNEVIDAIKSNLTHEEWIMYKDIIVSLVRVYNLDLKDNFKITDDYNFNAVLNKTEYIDLLEKINLVSRYFKDYNDTVSIDELIYKLQCNFSYKEWIENKDNIKFIFRFFTRYINDYYSFNDDCEYESKLEKFDKFSNLLEKIRLLYYHVIEIDSIYDIISNEKFSNMKITMDQQEWIISKDAIDYTGYRYRRYGKLYVPLDKYTYSTSIQKNDFINLREEILVTRTHTS